MRRLAILVCIAMFSGLCVVHVEAGSGRHGNRDHGSFRPDEEKEVSEVPEDRGNPSEQITTLIKEGQYEKARQLAQAILHRRGKSLGPEAPELADNLQRLANVEILLQHRLKAIDHYQRALQIREKVFGPEAPKTADTLARLGRAYTEVGAYDKALPMVERSLAIREKVLGPDSPETAGSLAILANLKRQVGAHAQALSLAQRALQIREKTLGPDHPITADTLDLLAQIYQQQGAVDQALPLAERALKIKEKALGLQHPETAKTHRILGILQQGRQNYAQAESSFQKGRSGQQGLGGLAEVYLSTGRYTQALETLDSQAPKVRARPQFLAQYYSQRGAALQGLGRRGEAAAAYLEAINTIEALRARTPGERSSFFEAGMVKGYYQSYLALISLLAEMAQKAEPLPAAFQPYGQDAGATAFYFVESIKARALLEAMAAKAREGMNKDIPPDLAAKEQELQAKWHALQGRWDEVYLPHRHRDRDVAAYLSEQEALQKNSRS
jgi:tetratricopeptide (TPR) repeat protein